MAVPNNQPQMVQNTGPFQQQHPSRAVNRTARTTKMLEHWLNDHKKNPYPTKEEKMLLATVTKLSLTQISTWFANARRRMVKEGKMTWSPRRHPNSDDDFDVIVSENVKDDVNDGNSFMEWDTCDEHEVTFKNLDVGVETVEGKSITAKQNCDGSDETTKEDEEKENEWVVIPSI